MSHLLRVLETFKTQGIEFVSFSEQMDTSTPAGKMVFTVLGTVAELERSLIVERVKAGLRNAKAKGKRIGRPKVDADAAKIAGLRKAGRSWSEITRETGDLPKERRREPFIACPKTLCGLFLRWAKSQLSGKHIYQALGLLLPGSA